MQCKKAAGKMSKTDRLGMEHDFPEYSNYTIKSAIMGITATAGCRVH